MTSLHLGPNGGLLYCMEFLNENIDWLEERLAPLVKEGYYIIIDCPGQVELFTLNTGLQNAIKTLTDKLHIRLAAVELVDAHLCSDAGKFLAALLLSLSSMLHLELPHINVLSKADLVEAYGELHFNLDYYTEVQDLSQLVDTMGNDAFGRRYRKLSGALAEVIEDYGLVNYTPLAIEDKDSVQRVLALVDKATGYVFAGLADKSPYPPEFVYGAVAADSGVADMWDKHQAQQELKVHEREPS
ncbi:g8055 [Coccomyxa elongata]